MYQSISRVFSRVLLIDIVWYAAYHILHMTDSGLQKCMYQWNSSQELGNWTFWTEMMLTSSCCWHLKVSHRLMMLVAIICWWYDQIGHHHSRWQWCWWRFLVVGDRFSVLVTKVQCSWHLLDVAIWPIECGHPIELHNSHWYNLYRSRCKV